MAGMETFEAKTLYGDWKGTASADEHGNGDASFEQLFENTGKVNKETEILIGFELSVGEGSCFLHGYFHRKCKEPGTQGTIPTLDRKLRADLKPIQVRGVRMEITPQEFFHHFKQFRVVMIDGGLDIRGREYEIIEEVHASAPAKK
jgi:hypothetical protein